MPVTERAICLRRQDFSETSQIVTFLTAGHGKVGVIAKGIKRGKRAAAIDLLSVGNIVYIEKADTLSILSQWYEEYAWPQIRADMSAWYRAMFVAELVDRLLEPHEAVPGLLERVTRVLHDVGRWPDAAVSLARFTENFLTDTGLVPNMSQCVSCAADVSSDSRVVYVSATQGGVVCDKCAPRVRDKVRARGSTIRFLQHGDDCDPVRAAAALRLQLYYIRHVLDRPLRTQAMIDQDMQSLRQRGQPGG